MKILSLLLVAVSVAALHAAAAPSASTPTWTEVAPGVWKATVGKPEDLTLLKAAGGAPAMKALAAMPKAEFPLQKEEIEAKLIDWMTTLRFPLAANEDIYG